MMTATTDPAAKPVSETEAAYNYRLLNTEEWMKLVPLCASRGKEVPCLPVLATAAVAEDSGTGELAGALFFQSFYHMEPVVTAPGKHPSLQKMVRVLEDAIKAVVGPDQKVRYLVLVQNDPAALAAAKAHGLVRMEGYLPFEKEI